MGMQEFVDMQEKAKLLHEKKLKLEGQFEEIKRQYKETYDISSIKEAKAMIQQLTKDTDILSALLEKKEQAAKDKFDALDIADE